MSNGTNTPYGLLAVQSNIGNGGTQKLTAYTIATGGALPIFSGDPVIFAGAGTVVAGNPAAGTIIPAYTAVSNAIATRNGTLGNNTINGILGIFISCTYQSAQTNLVLQQVPYYPGNVAVAPGTSIIVYINDDPEVIFQVQVSTALNNPAPALTANNLPPYGAIYQTSWNGQNANLQIGGTPFTVNPNNYAQNITNAAMFQGNIMNGLSSYYLDGDSIDPRVGTLGNPLFDVKIIGLAGQPQGSGSIVSGVPQQITVGTTPFVNLLCKFNFHMYGAPTAGIYQTA